MSPVVLPLPCPLLGTSFSDRGVQLGWKVIQISGVPRAFAEPVPALLNASRDEGTCVWVLVHQQLHSSKMFFIFFSAPFLMSHLIYRWLLSTKADVSMDPPVITPNVTPEW